LRGPIDGRYVEVHPGASTGLDARPHLQPAPEGTVRSAAMTPGTVADSFKTTDGHVVRMISMRNLEALPNVGPAVAKKLELLGINDERDLRDQDPDVLFERLCAIEGRSHDPCLLDTFTAVVDHVRGAPARPWWDYSRQRKAAEAAAAAAGGDRDSRQPQPEPSTRRGP